MKCHAMYPAWTTRSGDLVLWAGDLLRDLRYPCLRNITYDSGMTFLVEMPLGEGAPGTSLRVLFESDLTIRSRELDKRHELPGPERPGVAGAAGVMHRETPLHTSVIPV